MEVIMTNHQKVIPVIAYFTERDCICLKKTMSPKNLINFFMILMFVVCTKLIAFLPLPTKFRHQLF
jgi:hypothetical protein